MSKARALRATCVLVWRPGYLWKHGPIRDAIEGLGVQVLRMRFCHFGLKYDRANTLPSESYLQVTTTCARIPTNSWRCARSIAGKPAEPTEHILDWYGQGAQKAKWRNKTLAIMTAGLIDQMDLHKAHRSHTGAVHLSIHIRIYKGARTYVQSPKHGP
eukprot:3482117-Pyramimonas_sp.AAC.2